MAELKIGGSDVGKLMYNGQELGGATKLEPGTILYMYATQGDGFENIHLFSTTKNWSNVDGIHIVVYKDSFVSPISEFDISGDDFKNLDIKKTHDIYSMTITV